MRKLAVDNLELLRQTLQGECESSTRLRFLHRLHAVVLVGGGLSCYHVAKLLGDHPRTIERWVHKAKSNGIDGLCDNEKYGRPPKIDPILFDELKADYLQSPKVFGYDQERWSGKLFSLHINERHGVDLGIRQCQRLFNKFKV